MVLEVGYGLGSAAFLILTALTLLNRRPSGMGLFAVIVFATTAIWALSASVQSWWMPGVTHTLEGVRSWIWLQFMASVLMAAERRLPGRGSAKLFRFGIPALGLLIVANDLRFLVATASPVDFDPSQIYERVLVSIVGLLMVENLLRNTVASRRWHIFPLCLAAGAMFAFDLFVFAEALVV